MYLSWIIRCIANPRAQPKVRISPYCSPSPSGFNKKYIPRVASKLAIHILKDIFCSFNITKIIGTIIIDVPVIKADLVGVVCISP